MAPYFEPRHAGFESAAGDAAVAGVHREPARLLAEAGKKIAADSRLLNR